VEIHLNREFLFTGFHVIYARMALYRELTVVPYSAYPTANMKPFGEHDWKMGQL
jgi:hypothetical protein